MAARSPLPWDRTAPQRKRTLAPVRILTLILLAGLWLGTMERAAAITIIVTPTTPNGWVTFETDQTGTVASTAGSVTFVDGPGTPPNGTGSLNFQTGPGEGDFSVQAYTNTFLGTRLDDISQLSYTTFATTFNGQQLPYLLLGVDTGDILNPTDYLIFEPAYQAFPGPQALNTWQTWDVASGQFWNGLADFNPGFGNTGSLAQYLSLYPDATINLLGGVRLITGFASAGDNFNTNVGDLSFTTSGGNTTFLFATAVPELDPSSFALPFGALAATALILLDRRKKTA